MEPLAIPPLQRRTRSVSAEVAAHLERIVISGGIGAGERLPSERALATSLDVSRATIREALSELESKHLIVRRQGRGSSVLGPGKDDVALRDGLGSLDVELSYATELRDLVEPRIAAFAAQRAAESDLLQLEELVAQSNENLNATESLRIDRDFHTQLARAAHNPLLVALAEMTGDWTASVRARSHATAAARRISLAGHLGILDAVRLSDPEAAQSAMTRHLTDVSDLISSDTVADEP